MEARWLVCVCCNKPTRDPVTKRATSIVVFQCGHTVHRHCAYLGHHRCPDCANLVKYDPNVRHAPNMAPFDPFAKQLYKSEAQVVPTSADDDS